MIIYVIYKNGGNENSPYSLKLMVNYHYQSENRVITRQFPSMGGGQSPATSLARNYFRERLWGENGSDRGSGSSPGPTLLTMT